MAVSENQKIMNRYYKIIQDPTTDNIQRCQRHKGVDVHQLPGSLLPQPLHQNRALLVKHLDKLLQDLEVKRRRQDLPLVEPLLPGAQQQSIAEPRDQKLVQLALPDQLLAAEDRFRDRVVAAEQRQPAADPHAKQLAILPAEVRYEGPGV